MSVSVQLLHQGHDPLSSHMVYYQTPEKEGQKNDKWRRYSVSHCRGASSSGDFCLRGSCSQWSVPELLSSANSAKWIVMLPSDSPRVQTASNEWA
ncbi:hypothetical protein BaRGS_00020821, partial [Batillaria attramentaria]